MVGGWRGIYAIGRIASLPHEESNEFGDSRADVTFESRVNPPLLRVESDAAPILSAASALTGLMGTSLALSAEADARLDEFGAQPDALTDCPHPA
jgi:hypothetical protein